MAVGIAAGVRPPQINALGGSNPFEMVKTMYDLRNMQQQYQSNLEAGQIMAASPDLETAIQTMRRSPNAAWMLPSMQSIREQQRTEADIRKIGAETTRTQFNNGIEAANWVARAAPDDPAGFQRVADSVRAGLPKEAQVWFDDWAHSITDGDPAGFAKRRIASRLGAGMTAPEVAAVSGHAAPQIHIAPLGPGGAMQPFEFSGGQVTPIGGTPTGGGLGQSTVPTGQTPGQVRQQETRGTELGEYKGRLESSVETGSNLIANVNEARQALTAFETRPGRETWKRLAEVAGTFGASKATMDKIAGGDLASAQEFEKLIATQAMTQLDAALPSGSRVNIREWQAFQAANPNLNLMPGAIRKIFDFWNRTNLRNRMELSELNKYQTQGGDMEKWRDEWQRRQGSRGLLGSQFTTTRDGKTMFVNPDAVRHLLDNPDTASQFDSAYGPGSSKRFLGE